MRETIEWSIDSLGGYATLCIDTRAFSETAILKTAYWFTDKFYLYLSKLQEDPLFFCVEIRLKAECTDSKETLEITCRDFSNSLIDQEVRQKVLAETSNIRDTLVQKAFFEGKPRAPVKNS